MEQMLFLVPVVGLLGLLFAIILRQQVIKDPTRMCVGTARTARIIFGDITAISYRKRGKS